MHGGLFTHPSHLVQESKESLEQFLEANEKQGMSIREQTAAGVELDCWSRPPPDKINWDVGIDEKNNRLGMGVIIRDSSGAVIAARSLTIQTKQEPVIGEAIEALYAASRVWTRYRSTRCYFRGGFSDCD